MCIHTCDLINTNFLIYLEILCKKRVLVFIIEMDKNKVAKSLKKLNEGKKAKFYYKICCRWYLTFVSRSPNSKKEYEKQQLYNNNF